jgi:hypothetical protein
VDHNEINSDKFWLNFTVNVNQLQSFTHISQIYGFFKKAIIIYVEIIKQ